MDVVAGKVAVVTGAASGIGLALAQRFAAAGMHVVCADVDAQTLETAVAKLDAFGTEVFGVVTDVREFAQVDALADAAFGRFGAVHIVCNNAGVGGSGGGPVWEIEPTEWEWVLGVNVLGVVHGLHAFVPRMLAGGESGHIVNTSSIAGLVPIPQMAPYSASKHAVVGISQAAFHELRAMGAPIGVSVLCPAFVRTALAESGRLRPAEFGGPVALAPDDEMGQLIKAFVDGGIEPEIVADRVLDAVCQDRFWVLTHDDMLPVLRAHYDRLLDAQNPTPPL